MFLFFMLCSSYYSSYRRNDNYSYGSSFAGYGSSGYSSSYPDSDEDDDLSYSSKKISDYSKTDKNYAQGKIPTKLSHRLSEIFSTQEMRRILGIPNTVVDLRQWHVADLSDHLSKRKSEVIKRAVESLHGLLQEKYPYFLDSGKTLIQQVVEETFNDKQAAAINQLLKLVQTTLKEEKNKSLEMEKKVAAIKQQMPGIKRQMFENKARARAAEKTLDQKIQNLTKQIETNISEQEKKYAQEELADLQEEKNLLLVDPEHIRDDIKKQTEKLLKIKEQRDLIQSDIEKFKTMFEELSEITSQQESRTDELQDTWNGINSHFKKLEEAKEKDETHKAEERQKKKEKEAQKESEEKEKENSTLSLLKKSSGDIPEVGKGTSGFFDIIGQLFKTNG